MTNERDESPWLGLPDGAARERELTMLRSGGFPEHRADEWGEGCYMCGSGEAEADGAVAIFEVRRCGFCSSACAIAGLSDDPCDFEEQLSYARLLGNLVAIYDTARNEAVPEIASVAGETARSGGGE